MYTLKRTEMLSCLCRELHKHSVQSNGGNQPHHVPFVALPSFYKNRIRYWNVY